MRRHKFVQSSQNPALNRRVIKISVNLRIRPAIGPFFLAAAPLEEIVGPNSNVAGRPAQIPRGVDNVASNNLFQDAHDGFHFLLPKEFVGIRASIFPTRIDCARRGKIKTLIENIPRFGRLAECLSTGNIFRPADLFVGCALNGPRPLRFNPTAFLSASAHSNPFSVAREQ